MSSVSVYFCVESDLCKDIRKQLSDDELFVADGFLSPTEVAAEFTARRGDRHFVFYEHPAVSIAGAPSTMKVDLLLADVLKTASELINLKNASDDVSLVCVDSLPRDDRGEVTIFGKGFESALTEVVTRPEPTQWLLSRYPEALVRAVLMSNREVALLLKELESNSVNLGSDELVQLSALLQELCRNATQARDLQLMESVLADSQLRADRLESWLDALKHSISWRLTSPLRRAAGVLQSTLRKLR